MDYAIGVMLKGLVVASLYNLPRNGEAPPLYFFVGVVWTCICSLLFVALQDNWIWADLRDPVSEAEGLAAEIDECRSSDSEGPSEGDDSDSSDGQDGI